MERKDEIENHRFNHEVRPERPLAELITTLMRGKWVIISVFLLVLGGAIAYTLSLDPVYQASSMVLIDARTEAGTLPLLNETGAPTTTMMSNELGVLWARSTATKVAQALLDKTYIDRDRTTLIPIIRAEVDGTPQNTKDSLDAVTDRLYDHVNFHAGKESDILQITARSSDPREAALIANTYTRVYSEQNLTASRAKTRAIREFLQTQMRSKHAALDTTENALQAYMHSSGVLSLDAEASKVVNQLAGLEAMRDGIGVDISARMQTLNSYKQELAEQEPIVRAVGESNDTYIRLLQEQLARLEVQRDVVIAQNPDLSGEKIYSEKLKEIDGEIAVLRKTLEKRTKAFLGTVVPGGRSSSPVGGTIDFLSQMKQRIVEQQIELDGLVAKKNALNSVIAEHEQQFNRIPQKSIEFAKLQRARVSDEKLYLLIEEKFNEAAIKESSEFGRLSILDTAVVPKEPVSPKHVTNVILGAVLGLFLGVGVVLARAAIDDRIRTPEDLKKYGTRPIAAVGTLDLRKRGNGKGEKTVHPGTPRFDEKLVAFLNPLSSPAEAYRQLRSNIQYSTPDHPAHTILVTSPSPEEGKSTTVCNLAISFAQGENRVLLVDADMRRPAVSSFFGLAKEPGLANVIFGKTAFEAAVHRKIIDNMDVLCCGTMPPNPAEVLGSRAMQAFVDQVKILYDVVLFDTPPLLAVTDGAILSRLADAVLIVVSSGKTLLGSLEHAAEVLDGVGKSPTGIVLNNLNLQKAYGGYARQRQKYYNYDGYTGNGKERPRTK